MDDLLKQIQHKSVQKYYIFAGPETYLMQQYLAHISELIGKGIQRVESVNEIVSGLGKSSLIATSNLYVVQDDKDYTKKANEHLWDILPSRLGNDGLILIYTNPDKRSNLFKRSEVVSFDWLPADKVARILMKDCPLSFDRAKQLAEVCENSIGRGLLECDKINNYVQSVTEAGRSISYDAAFRQLIDEGVIFKPVGDVTFPIVDAIMKRKNVRRIQQCMQDMRDAHEPRLRLLSLLYSNFRALLLYQSTPSCSDEEMRSHTGLTQREINFAKWNVNNYELPEIKRCLDLIQELESGIKLGQIPEEIVIDYFIAEVI